ncbi:MAG: TIGR03088 family PEP-CTERM/XrtA system glycosyltransferase [Casimicrobiaceae bacterium]
MIEATPPLVMHVIHHLVTGGMENGLINLIDGMPEAHFRHAIVCIEDYSDFRHRLKRQDVEIIPLHRSRVGIWRVRRQLYQLCRRLRPAIVHTRNLSGLDALLPARLAGVRCCVHGEHGWDVDDVRGERLRPALLRRLHAPAVDHYVTVSQDLGRYLVRRAGVPESRVTSICNGVDLERFSPSSPTQGDVLPAHFRGEELIVFGTVGRIQPIKDQATLLRAFAELVRVDPALGARVRLAIIGDGPLLSGLRQLAESLGIGNSVWLPGAISNVPQMLRLMQVFVLTSLNEGISNTILEAMASGLPVIATDVGGNGELIVDGATGSLVPAGDANALAQVLWQYASNGDLARERGRAGRMRAESLYGIDAMIAQYASLYDRLLAGRYGALRGEPATHAARVTTGSN